MTTPNLADLAAAVRWAADRLDAEEHRYVERYAPCPNGCVYDYANGVTVGDQHREWPTNTPPVLVKVAGPDDCTECEDGTIEDEDAPWLDDRLALLRAAADALAAPPGADRARGLDALIPKDQP